MSRLPVTQTTQRLATAVFTVFALAVTLVLLLFVSQSSWAKSQSNNAELELQQLLERIRSPQRIRSHFTQTKSMKILKRPLQSQGRMYFDRQTGLLWQIYSPFEETLVITENYVSRSSNGDSKDVTASNDPGTYIFAKIFLEVLTGETESLLKQFELQLEPYDDSTGWQIVLTPSQKNLAQVLASIRFTGSDDIESVSIDTLSGDNTRIEFTQRQTENISATQEELAYFER